ncbi:MAG: SMP-30/gluconolactonase/LRE family protein, partial [Parafilimonas terrae]|nr:SMP-30/gluconolactonase/LRE family protein [Parafilimonas terrae]
MSFFAPPPAVTAEIFTRLPDRFRKVRPTAWANANRGGHAIDSFLEGPVFDRAGRLYVTDIPFGRIFRIDQAGEWDLVAEYDGWPNGMKIHRDGRIFITCYKRGLMLLDPDTGAVTPFLDTAGSEGFRGVNDLTFAKTGDLYFTDQGQTGLQDPTGRVYRLRPSGELTCLVDTVPSPNGIVIDDAMGSLFVAVSRAQQIWRIPLNAS